MTIPITRIVVASDHAGFAQKEIIRQWLETRGGVVVEDCGAYTYDAEDDYPAFMFDASKKVATDPTAVAVLFGGSGQGEAMMANRVRGVRAVVYYGGNDDIIRLSREHNGANVLSFGARFVAVDEMKSAIELWLQTPAFASEKYQRRAAQMDNLT
jgi:ribose 5-phosphate isomerase B